MPNNRSRSSGHRQSAASFDDSSRAAQLLQELQQFTGDLLRYCHPLNRQVIYTPGVHSLIEEAGAGWLIDAIATHLASASFRRAIRRDERIALHFWKLIVRKDRSALLQAVPDTDEPAFIKQSISFTDFPLPEIEVWAGHDGQHWTLCLPNEY